MPMRVVTRTRTGTIAGIAVIVLLMVGFALPKAEAARRLGVKPTHLQYLLNESKAAKKKKEPSSTAKIAQESVSAEP